MSPNFYQKYSNLLKLLSYSIATVMTLGLVVGIPREVAGETQSVQSAQQSAQLAEAERLIERANKLEEEGNNEKAILVQEKALAIQEKVLGKEHLEVVNTLNGLAELYKSKGILISYKKALAKESYAKAEALYLRSLAIQEKILGKEHPDVATTLYDLAELYHYEMPGEFNPEPLYLRSLAIREKVLGKQHPDVATSLHGLARFYDRSAEFNIHKIRKAEALYLRSLAIREKVVGEENSSVADTLEDLALFYKRQGNYTKAESLCLRFLAIQEKKLGNSYLNEPWNRRILDELASLYKEQGKYTQLESLYLRRLAIFEKVMDKENDGQADVVVNDLANLYKEQGNYTKVESLYLRYLPIFEKVMGKENYDVAYTLENLANFYTEQGDFVKAEPLYLRSLAIQKKLFGKEYLDDSRYFLTLQDLVELYKLQGNYTKAKSLLLDLWANHRKGEGGLLLEWSISQLGEIYNLEGSYATAEPLLLLSLVIEKENALNQERSFSIAIALNFLARNYWAWGNISKTIDYLSRGLSIEENFLQGMYSKGSEESRQFILRVFNQHSQSINMVISLALQKSAKNPSIAKLALTTALRRKGRMQDAMTDIVQTLRPHLADNPEIKKSFDEWLDVNQQLAKLVYSKPDKQNIEASQIQIKRLQGLKGLLEEQMSSKSAEFRKEIQPIELAPIQAKIPQNAALVEIVQYKPFNPKAQYHKRFAKPRYAAVVLRQTGEPKWVDLGDAATIDQSVENFRKALKSPASYYKNQGEKVSRKLDNLIMAPIRPLLGDASHLLLSPDGQLNLIPFEALKDENNQYLVERYSFSYLTTGRDLLRFDMQAKQLSNPVVFSDIDYEGYENTVIAKNTHSKNQRSVDFKNLNYDSLPGTSGEGKAIKAIFSNTNLFTGKQATETTIKQLKAPSILHLATHGFFLPDQKVDNNKIEKSKNFRLENPFLRSGLALAGFNNRQNKQNNNTEDGVLTALEVAGLNLRGTKLVVLSACQTGLGEVKTGDGVYGLRRALVIAGSQSQLLSLWKVPDNGTKDLMVKYYQNLKAGKGRHEALREVQLEFIKSSQYKNPYYWAGFIPSGNWKEMKLVR